MFWKTNDGETPSDSAQEAADDHLESSRTADPHEEPHGDDCRCAYCSRELTDDASIAAGYGPVCAKNHDQPWGGSGNEQAEDYTPSWERLSGLRRVCHSALTAGRGYLSWTRNTILPRMRAAFSRGRGSLHPWLQGTMSRLRRFRLAAIAERHWSRTTPRSRRVVLAVCTVSAAILAVIGVRGWLVDDGPAAPRHHGASAAAAAVKIHEVKQPILFHVRVGSAEAVCKASAGKRRQMAAATARRILPVVASRPEQMVVICLQDLPLSFSLLPASEQTQFEQQLGPNAAKRYEASVAAFLNATISAVERKQPNAVLSVLGLPIEPEQAGVSMEIARQSNQRYGTVIDRVGPFVPGRKFVVFGSTLDEKLLARMGMREALRLREGRPIVFQTNLVWNTLVDDDGLDYQEYVVAHASGKLEQHRGSSRYGDQDVEVQALLGDDGYWE
ncbi:MAG: DUF6011 domain-containing protein [Planctomycetota bacterium]|jgi:hypothetical protein